MDDDDDGRLPLVRDKNKSIFTTQRKVSLFTFFLFSFSIHSFSIGRVTDQSIDSYFII